MNKDELLDLIEIGEGYTLEFKENFSSSIDKEICAFANSKGGKILLGVDNKGAVKGFNMSNTVKSQIQTIARNMDPAFSVDIKQINNISVINVPEGKEKPCSAGGKYYLRIGANSQKMNRNELRLFFQNQGLVNFDEKQNPKFNIKKDFNDEAFQGFLDRAKIKESLSRQRLLVNLGFLKQNKINNAGILFFCKYLSNFLLNANITCVLYQGDSKYKILDKKVFEKDLISNYEDAFSYLKDKLNTEYIIKRERTEKLELPEDALREAILNAIAHRDYFSNSHIQVNIFKNSLEIVNPASYPRNITIKDLLKGSHPKNLFLFSMMQRANLVEKVGSGIKRIVDAMRTYNLTLPKFEYETVWFRIEFKRPDLQLYSYQTRVGGTVTGTVTGTQKQILREINMNPNITYDEIAERIGKSRRTVVRQMNELKKIDVVKRIGSDKSGHWEIIKQDLEQK